MADIRFKNLPKLLNDIRTKGWKLDSFLFEYNGVKTIVVLRIYEGDERKPDKYAVADIEFVNQKDISNSIRGYIDFYEVHFENFNEFIDFFAIKDRGKGRDLFLDFAVFFSKFIPAEKKIQKENDIERRVLASRTEPNDPDAIYCKDVKRNGKYPDGTPHQRSIENSNKAELLREKLYLKYKDDLNYSFYFSKNPEDERSDEEIMLNVAQREE